MATRLSVNLNAVAMLRNRRDLAWPSVTGIGRLALMAGAHGLTVHPRPDERHIRRSDVFDVAALITNEFKAKEFNIEGYPDERFVELISEVRPDQVTLVPDDPSQVTSDHGWDIDGHREMLEPLIKHLQSLSCRVSLFIDTDSRAAKLAGEIGADRVELYTGPYGALGEGAARESELKKIRATAAMALAGGLELNAGHDLTLENLPPLIEAVPEIVEASIGHCFTADSLIYGVEETVKRYLAKLGH